MRRFTRSRRSSKSSKKISRCVYFSFFAMYNCCMTRQVCNMIQNLWNRSPESTKFLGKKAIWGQGSLIFNCLFYQFLTSFYENIHFLHMQKSPNNEKLQIKFVPAKLLRPNLTSIKLYSSNLVSKFKGKPFSLLEMHPKVLKCKTVVLTVVASGILFACFSTVEFFSFISTFYS